MQKISFVIPCYRSENTLTFVIDEIMKVMVELKSYTYEIILVCDASPDNTFSVISELCDKYSDKIKGIDLSRNFGQHSAMMAGFSHCTGDIIVDVDDDGQIPLDELYKMLDKINEGYDIAVGKYDVTSNNIFRRLGTKINDVMANFLIGKPKDIEFTSFVVMRKYVVDEILKYKNKYPYLAGLMLQSTNKIVNVPVAHRERKAGQSGYSLKKLLSLWLNGFTAFSVKPLRIATVLGVICAFIGFVFGVYVIVSKIIHPEMVAGYSSTMAVLLFIGGMIMLMLGMIGEYIGRIYISINNSPQYVIREKINIDDEDIKHVR